MSRTPQRRIISLTTGTVMATGLGMIPLHRLPRAVKTGYIVLPAALGAGAMLIALRRHDSQPLESDGAASFAASASRSRSPAVHATLPLAVGGIIAGSSVLSLWMDRGIEEFLHRRGVPAPRLAMALASGALSLAMGIAEERREAREAQRTLEERVLATLSEADPMRLEPGHRGGAPGDEFLREAEMIAVILRRDARPGVGGMFRPVDDRAGRRDPDRVPGRGAHRRGRTAHFCAERSLISRSSGKSIGLPGNSSRPAACADSRIAAAAASA